MLLWLLDQGRTRSLGQTQAGDNESSAAPIRSLQFFDTGLGGLPPAKEKE